MIVHEPVNYPRSLEVALCINGSVYKGIKDTSDSHNLVRKDIITQATGIKELEESVN